MIDVRCARANSTYAPIDDDTGVIHRRGEWGSACFFSPSGFMASCHHDYFVISGVHLRDYCYYYSEPYGFQFDSIRLHCTLTWGASFISDGFARRCEQ